jgi:hypothetical protein
MSSRTYSSRQAVRKIRFAAQTCRGTPPRSSQNGILRLALIPNALGELRAEGVDGRDHVQERPPLPHLASLPLRGQRSSGLRESAHRPIGVQLNVRQELEKDASVREHDMGCAPTRWYCCPLSSAGLCSEIKRPANPFRRLLPSSGA